MDSKKKKLLITILVLILLAVFSFLGAIAFVQSKLSSIKTVSIPHDAELLGINQNKFPVTGLSHKNVGETAILVSSPATSAKSPTIDSKKIINILLLGIDSRNPDKDTGRSDAIMILTIDKHHNSLKLTSILRDSYVKIDGHGQEKLTHAYAYGGALLAIKTINQNYDLNITDYVKVNFAGFESIIDYLGGVPIDITLEELPDENFYISELARLGHKEPTYITSPGLQNMNGMQTVAYSRIRYVGNEDFQRSVRQRTILTTLFQKLSHIRITDIPGLADNILPYIETSLSAEEMIRLGNYVLVHRINAIQQSRIPYDDLFKNANIDGMDVELWDKEPTIKRLHGFIFDR